MGEVLERQHTKRIRDLSPSKGSSSDSSPTGLPDVTGARRRVQPTARLRFFVLGDIVDYSSEKEPKNLTNQVSYTSEIQEKCNQILHRIKELKEKYSNFLKENNNYNSIMFKSYFARKKENRFRWGLTQTVSPLLRSPERTSVSAFYKGKYMEIANTSIVDTIAENAISNIKPTTKAQ